MLALYRGANSMHDARTDLARMTGQCRGNRLQKAVAAVQRQSPAARRMASISSSDSLSMGEASVAVAVPACDLGALIEWNPSPSSARPRGFS